MCPSEIQTSIFLLNVSFHPQTGEVWRNYFPALYPSAGGHISLRMRGAARHGVPQFKAKLAQLASPRMSKCFSIYAGTKRGNSSSMEKERFYVTTLFLKFVILLSEGSFEGLLCFLGLDRRPGSWRPQREQKFVIV